MKRRERLKYRAIGLILMISLFLLPVSAAGASDPPKPSLTITQILEDEGGTDAGSQPSDYLLVAAGDNEPLPEESAGGEYRFTLTGNASFVIDILAEEGGQASEDPTGDAAIHFEEPGLYHYTLSQVIPETPDAVERDTTVYEIFVLVTRNGKLKIEAVWAELPNGDKPERIDFTNRARKQKVIGDPPVSVEKRVAGDIPTKKDPFVFAMVPVREGDPLPYGAQGRYEVTLYGAGEIEIGNIEFEEVGTYEYTVNEVKGNTEGYTYDETVYRVIYEVRQKSDGTMTCDRQILKKEQPVTRCSFTNQYKNPTNTSPGKGTAGKSSAGPVKTGDASHVLWYLGVFLMAALLLKNCIRARRSP